MIILEENEDYRGDSSPYSVIREAKSSSSLKVEVMRCEEEKVNTCLKIANGEVSL